MELYLKNNAPHLKYVNLKKRGFMFLDIDRAQIKNQWITVEVGSRNNKFTVDNTLYMLDKQNRISGYKPRKWFEKLGN